MNCICSSVREIGENWFPSKTTWKILGRQAIHCHWNWIYWSHATRGSLLPSCQQDSKDTQPRLAHPIAHMYKIWPSSRSTVKSNQFAVKVPAGFSSGQWQREKYLSKSSLNDTNCNKQSWMPNTWIICNRESDDPIEKRQSHQHKPNPPQPGTVLQTSTRRNNYVNDNLPVTSMISFVMTLLVDKMFELNWTSFGAHDNWTFNQLKF